MQLQDAPSPLTVVPRGNVADAGPWRLTVQRVQAGEEATATLMAANAGNPDVPEGLVYVLAYLTAENTTDRAQIINGSDFAAAGPDGILRRPPALIIPNPALQGAVDGGGVLEGWVPLTVSDPGNIVLWFASPFLGGTWSEATLALTDGATLPAFDPPDDDPRRGLSADAPAALNERVRAGAWDVTVVEHISGEAVFTIAEFALQALAGGNPGDPEVGTWHAVRVRATNITERPAFFSFTALRLAAADGRAWDHILALTPPLPDVAKEVLPGATREGWAAFQLPPWATLDLLRIQPSRVADEPRFVSFTGGGAAPAATPVAGLPQYAEGDQVVLDADHINLRDAPSADGGVIADLAIGTELTITGAAVEADGYVWYPVGTGDGQSGYVAADFLLPAPGT